MRAFISLSLLLLAFTLPLNAASYNRTMMEMQANILPKLLLMDYNFEQKLVDGKIRILILFQPEDKNEAEEFRDALLEKYPEGVRSYPLEVSLSTFSSFSGEQKASAYYLMEGEARAYKKVVEKASKEELITFCYNPSHVDRGVNTSLSVQRAAKPLINLSSLEKSNIKFRPALMRIAEFK